MLRRNHPLKDHLRRRAARLYNRLRPVRLTTVAAHLRDKRVVTPAETVTFAQPPACEFLHLQSYAPHEGCAVTRRETFVGVLPDVILDFKTGLLHLPDGQVFLEAAVDAPRIHTLRQNYLPPRVERLSGTYTSIWGQFTHNYGHWMVECLLRLYLLSTIPEPPTVIMPATLTPVQRESLEACLPEGVTLRYLNPRQAVRVEQFVYLSHATSGTSFYFPPPAALDYVRQRIVAHFGIPSPQPRHRIYIRRHRASYRHVTNEDQVVSALAGSGFQAYDLEDLSLRDQVQLFHDAAFVISPHSSGLTNLIFAPSQLPVIEISSRAPEPSFFFLAMARRQRYHYLFAQGVTPPYQFPTRQDQPQQLRDLINSSFTIDTEALTRLVDSILATE